MGRNNTKQDLKAREMTVFGTIPGMMELMQASPAQREKVETQYPDAVFAVVIASSLFNHNRELSEIAQRAYLSILNGENISSVRFAYDKDTDEYWKRHMWDDKKIQDLLQMTLQQVFSSLRDLAVKNQIPVPCRYRLRRGNTSLPAGERDNPR